MVLVHHVGNLLNVGHQLFIVSTCDEDGLVDVGHISDRDRFNLVRGASCRFCVSREAHEIRGRTSCVRRGL